MLRCKASVSNQTPSSIIQTFEVKYLFNCFRYRYQIVSRKLEAIMAGVPLQQQKIEDDYELWDPRNREDTRKGKGFVVSKVKLIVKIRINIAISSMLVQLLV